MKRWIIGLNLVGAAGMVVGLGLYLLGLDRVYLFILGAALILSMLAAAMREVRGNE